MKTGFKDPYSKGYSIPSSLRESNTYRLKYGTIFNHFKKVVEKKERLLNHNLLFVAKAILLWLSKKLQKAIKLEWWSTSRELNKLGLFSTSKFNYIIERPENSICRKKNLNS